MNSIAQTAAKSKDTIERNEKRSRTHEATVAGIFAAKERHDKRFERMIEQSYAADPNFNFDTGLLLAA